MQISIKQQEVTAAVRAYIAAQGINLAGKEFSVKYTAGRTADGLTAEVEILNKDLPDLIDDDASAAVASTAIAAASGKVKSVLKAVASEKPVDTEIAKEVSVKSEAAKVVVETADAIVEVVAEKVEDPAPTTKVATPSLFS